MLALYVSVLLCCMIAQQVAPRRAGVGAVSREDVGVRE